MRLISCHIDNFGRLSDLSFSFDEDKNIICQDNGWGKSTLAAFLRVMFFGLMNDNKRNDIDSDRRRYRPWQGGVFGGSLSFEVHGKKYLVTRQFKDKESEDFFEIRDLNTNLVSEDFTSNLGEEIFKINSESFIRTVFISQNDCVTATTDSINAKIGNLSDNMGDIDSYEDAVSILKNYLSQNSPKSVRGAIYKKKTELSQLYNRIRDDSAVEDSLARYESRIKENSDLLKGVREKMALIRKKEELLRENLAKKAGRETYNVLLEEENAAKKEVEALQSFFPGKIPSNDEIYSLKEVLKKYEEAGIVCENSALSLTEKDRLNVLNNKFSSGLRDENSEQFLSKEDADRLQYLTGIFGSQANYYDKASGLTSTYKDYLSIIDTVSSKEEKLAFYSSDTKKKAVLPFAAVGGLIMIILAIVSFFLNELPIALGLGIFGFVLLAVQIVAGTISKKDPNEAIKTMLGLEIEELRGEEEKLLCELGRKLEGLGRNINEATLDKHVSDINDMAWEYGNLLKKKESARLYEISNEKKELESLSERNESYERNLEKVKTSKAELDNGLERLGFYNISNYEKILDDLYLNVTKLEEALSNLRKRSQVRATFAEANDLSIDEETLDIDTDSLKREAEVLAKEEAKLTDMLAADRRTVQALYEKCDELSSNRALYDSLKKEIDQDIEKYELVGQAQKYLIVAKEKLTNEYTDPILSGFNHYYGIIARNNGSFHMDANTNLTVDEYGIQRNITSLSQGFRDLIGLCLRVALVEAMYPNERPVLFLDDPFVNLDDEKLSGGKVLLEEISRKYQIVYFTCTRMRV